MIKMFGQKRKFEESVSFDLKLVEKWDMKVLQKILETSHFSMDFSQRSLLKSISESISSNGELIVHYELSKAQRPFGIAGRVFNNRSYQGIQGWVKRLCCHKYYHDIDIVNCYPVILLQLAEKNDIEVQVLRQYVADRESILSNDMLEHKITRKAAKEAYLKVMFTGGVAYESIFLQQFKKRN